MKKYTQKELKAYIREGFSQDITTLSTEAMGKFLHKHNIDRVGYSCGKYGINGGLLEDRKTGELYTITARNSALMMAF